jgi:hypothetical protein
MITVIIDSTMLNSFQQCALQYDLAFNQDLEPLTTNEAIEEGQQVHFLMEPYYEAIKKGMDYKVALDYAITVGLEKAADLSLDQGECVEIVYAFKEYVDLYRTDYFEVLEVETPFAITLHQDDDLRVVYIGKIDLLVRTAKHAKQVIDHKKRRQNRKIDLKSNQFIGYCIATNTEYMEINSFGMQKTLPPKERFKRIPMHYPKEFQLSWIKNVTWWAQQYVYHHESGIWPENWTSCDKFSGCQFKEHCNQVTPEAKEHFRMTRFKKREVKWDPSKPLKEGAAKGKSPIIMTEV